MRHTPDSSLDRCEWAAPWRGGRCGASCAESTVAGAMVPREAAHHGSDGGDGGDAVAVASADVAAPMAVASAALPAWTAMRERPTTKRPVAAMATTVTRRSAAAGAAVAA